MAPSHTPVKAAVIVGTQWGDEGKGKITDFYAEDADLVVRYQGGNNAGHTVVLQDEKFKFHLIPSGATQKKRVVVGNGLVVDPAVLLAEVETLRERGFDPDLALSSTAHVIFPYHRIEDGLLDEAKGKYGAGTTKRGIGPAYGDKMARIGLRVSDLLDEAILREKLEWVVPLKQKWLEVLGYEEQLDLEAIYAEYLDFGKQITPFVADTAYLLNEALDAGRRVLLEGAQATMLCIDQGMYPYGTSSNAYAGGAPAGSGIGPTRIGTILGILKAYTSRVGGGPLPTELDGEIAHQIREEGHEYGTTTGRPRRVGWLDLVAVKYATIVNNLDGIFVTLLDVLQVVDTIKVCTAYELDGQISTQLPLQPKEIARVTPVYEEFSSWGRKTPAEWQAVTHAAQEQGLGALPTSMQEYLQFITEFLQVDLYGISLGPNRAETVKFKEIF